MGRSVFYGFSVRPWFLYYTAVAWSPCDINASCLAFFLAGSE